MNKLEKYIKEKLQTREIRPSEEAWNRIQEELVPTSKPKVIKFHWLAIAAGLFAALVLSIAYFNEQSPKEQLPIDVVETKIDETSKPLEVEGALQDKILKAAELAEKNEEGMANTPIGSHENDSNQVGSMVAVVFDKEVKKEISVPQSENRHAAKELIDKKLNEVLIEVALLEERNIEVTNTEVDSLLFAAQRELLTNKVFQESGAVDATALLADVEDELDRTFRGHLFEKLKEGYFKVRTAVADRNN